MSDLLSLLSLGSTALTAQNSGVGVASKNVANVNTQGYSRERVDLEALVGATGGVRAGAAGRINNSLLGARMRTAAGSLAQSNQRSEALANIESRLVNHGSSIDERIGKMMSRLHQVSAAPTDDNLRNAVVQSVQDLVDGIRERADELSAANDEANLRVRDHTKAASELAKQLADANLAVAKTDDPVLRDERDRLASKLSELVGGSARIDPDGQMRFVLDDGGVLVDGTRAIDFASSIDPTTGDERILLGTGISQRDVTSSVGGKLGGDTGFRDTTLATARTALDQLAYDMATTLNTTHAGNVALDGSTGRNLFVPPAAVAGAASTLALNPAITADTKLLATRAPGGGVGDNGGAIGLISSAAPFADRAIDFVAKIASEGQRVQGEVQRDTLANENLAALHDSISGVDLDEELANLSKFQHASAALTNFVSTIDQMLEDLISRL